MEEVQMMRLASLTPEIAEAMRVSFDGYPLEKISRKIADNEFALLQGISSKGVAYAVVSAKGDSVCLEAVEGPGGTELAARIVAYAKSAGYQAEAWVFNHARARLAKRAGMYLTGKTRESYSGKPQLHVSTK